MKRLLALILALALLLPVLAFAEEEGEDEEFEIVEITEDEYEVDENGNIILGEDHLTAEQISQLMDLTAELEIDDSIDPADLYINPNLPDDVINILLIGVDVRGTKEIQKLSEQMRYKEEDPTDNSVAKRSDVLMILSINLNEGTIRLTSIARNTYVEIPGRKNKSIIANSFGRAVYKNGKYHSWVDSPLTCVATVNKNFQLNIRHYVAINFFGVEEIIESLGGADINLTKAEAKAINNYLNMKVVYLKNPDGSYKIGSDGKRERKYHGAEIAATYDNHSEGRQKLQEKEGVQHLDGLQALMYARLREIDNDFVRTARTRHLLDSLLRPTMAKIKGGELDIFNLAADWTQYLITNMSILDMVQIAMGVLGSFSLDFLESVDSVISEFRIPEDKTYSYQTISGSSVTVMNNKQKTTESLHDFIYGEYIPAN